MVQSSL